MALYDLGGGGGGFDPSPQSGDVWAPKVRDWYQQYLGRAPENETAVTNWAGMGAGAEAGIRDSPEAVAYRQQQAPQYGDFVSQWNPGATAPSNAPPGMRWDANMANYVPSGGSASGGGSIYDQIRAYQNSHAASEGIGGIAGALGLGRYMYGQTPSNNELIVNGQKYKVLGGEDNPNTAFWYMGGDDSGGGGFNAAAGGGGYGAGGSIFDDPATADWYKLLSSRINSLNQPYQPPSFQPLTDYLKNYFEKLQGPAYTPQQLDLLQTQSLDPLSRERDAVHQRILEQASRRGLNPQSGIVQKQLSDADNQFEQIRTKTQAGFAAKAVDLDRINAQQAASVGQLLANIEQSNFNANENRANQALGYAQQIPDLARQRMLDANAILSQSQVNPAQLLSMQMQQNQYDQGQTQQYIMGLASLLPSLLPLFGVGKK